MKKIIGTLQILFFSFCLAVPTHALELKKEEKEIEIPTEELVAENTLLDNKFAKVTYNAGLENFEDREFFPWCCSVVFDFKNVSEKGMPTKEDAEKVISYIEHIDEVLKQYQDHPEALFIARITREGQLQAFWQLNDPRKANRFLNYLVKSNKFGYDMEYSIEYDKRWNNVSFFADDFSLYAQGTKDIYKIYLEELGRGE